MSTDQLELSMAPTFTRALSDLSPSQAAAVMDAVEKLQRGLEATHLHAMQGAPFKAFGVNRGALRVICEQDGPALFLLHVGAHDAAYEWARRHRIGRVGRAIRLVTLADPENEAPVEASPGGQRAPGPLAVVSEGSFRHFGVGSQAAFSGAVSQIHSAALY